MTSTSITAYELQQARRAYPDIPSPGVGLVGYGSNFQYRLCAARWLGACVLSQAGRYPYSAAGVIEASRSGSMLGRILNRR